MRETVKTMMQPKTKPYTFTMRSHDNEMLESPTWITDYLGGKKGRRKRKKELNKVGKVLFMKSFAYILWSQSKTIDSPPFCVFELIPNGVARLGVLSVLKLLCVNPRHGFSYSWMNKLPMHRTKALCAQYWWNYRNSLHPDSMSPIHCGKWRPIQTVVLAALTPLYP